MICHGANKWTVLCRAGQVLVPAGRRAHLQRSAACWRRAAPAPAQYVERPAAPQAWPGGRRQTPCGRAPGAAAGRPSPPCGARPRAPSPAHSAAGTAGLEAQVGDGDWESWVGAAGMLCAVEQEQLCSAQGQLGPQQQIGALLPWHLRSTLARPPPDKRCEVSLQGK